MKNITKLISLILLFSFLLNNYTYAKGIISNEEKPNSDSILVSVYLELSQQYQYNNIDSSIYYLKKVLQIAKQNNIKTLEAKALSKYGGNLYIKGDYDLALDYFFQGLNKYQLLNDKKGIAAGFNNIGMIYNIQGRTDKAILYHKQSVNICKQISDSNLLATNYFNIGISFEQYNVLDSSIIYANKAIIINKNIGKEENNLRIYNLKGRIYTHTNNFYNAEEMFTEVLNSNTKNNQWELSYAHDGLANLYLIYDKNEQSMFHANKAFKIAKKINAKWDIQNSANTLSKAFVKINRYDSAFKYLEICKIYGDSIFNKEKENHINYIELKNAEEKNAILIENHDFQLNQIEAKNKILFALLIGSIILIILILLIIYNYSQRNILTSSLKKKNNEIEIKNKELENLNNSKNLMFRIIAHDLMSPVSTLVSFTDLMLSRFDTLSKEETYEIIKTLNESTNQAYNLLENLLNWAKYQFGSTNIHPQDTNILELVKNVSAIFNDSINSKKLKFFINISDKINIQTDQNLVSSIIRNLIANAIKFTPLEGSISINATERQAKVEIIVADSGIGINQVTLNQLFSKNPVLSSVGTKGEKGSGLGLMLCKEFADQLKGEIWAESSPGNGSHFHLTLPNS